MVTHRDPAIEGVAYTPPGQVVMTSYWYFLSAFERYMMTLAPLGAIAYLWTSQEMLRGEQTRSVAGKRERQGGDAPRHAWNTEVERDGLVPRPLEEGNEERAEAAVDVQAEAVLDCEVRQGLDVCPVSCRQYPLESEQEERGKYRR